MAKGTVNKVFLLGRLGTDPEIRYMPSGMAVTNLSLATNDGYKDRQTGQFVENTEWHRVVLFGKQADIISQYTKKGSLLYIEGKIRTNKWKDQSGQDRYNTDIIATDFQLIGNRGENNNHEEASESPPLIQASPKTITEKKTTEIVSENQLEPDINHLNDFDDDDIPF